MLSRVCLFVIPWAVTHQAPLVHGISQARILQWIPPLGDLPDPGIESASPALAGRFFIPELPRKPLYKLEEDTIQSMATGYL